VVALEMTCGCARDDIPSVIPSEGPKDRSRGIYTVVFCQRDLSTSQLRCFARDDMWLLLYSSAYNKSDEAGEHGDFDGALCLMVILLFGLDDDVDE